MWLVLFRHECEHRFLNKLTVINLPIRNLKNSKSLPDLGKITLKSKHEDNTIGGLNFIRAMVRKCYS